VHRRAKGVTQRGALVVVEHLEDVFVGNRCEARSGGAVVGRAVREQRRVALGGRSRQEASRGGELSTGTRPLGPGAQPAQPRIQVDGVRGGRVEFTGDNQGHGRRTTEAIPQGLDRADFREGAHAREDETLAHPLAPGRALDEPLQQRKTSTSSTTHA
jgi:hypothetical protein